MNEERKRLIDEIFLGAVELPPDQRQAFLDHACPDVEIRREVSSLLAYDVSGASALDSVIQQAAASLVGGDPLIGAHLGPYRITEEIGKGGMGTVFLGIRDDRTFEKKVAIKIVQRGMDSVALLERFRHERRILANLDHPYVCRLLDAGTTPDGRPYFVMEYVEGQPVVAYCFNQRLTNAAILELFRKICDAVSCAHRNLIVHRDLKASNILVAQDGSPRLLDFGIAKLVDPHIRTEDTAPASRLLTLDCASPEQVRGEPVSTSTDVYSLGILLFQLLVRRPPWRFQSLSTGEAEQVICHAPAPRPSATLRASDQRANWRALAGDLDNIVLKALRKDPAERYRSVDELSSDIGRHLKGLPIIAREDSFFYKGMKFVGRHGAAVALAGITTAALVAGIIYANLERRQAEIRLNEMLAMANQTLLDLHTQIEHQPGATEARLRITQSTVTYLANLAKEAGDNQDVRTTLGTAYLRTGDIQGYPHSPNLGDTAGALASYNEAGKLFSPNDHLHQAILLWHRGDILCSLGRTVEAIPILRQGISHARRSKSAESLFAAAEMYHRVAFVLTQSNPDEALEDSRREMEIYSELAKREPENVDVLDGLASSYSTTGGALNRRMRFEEALALYRKGLAIREKLVAKNPNDVGLRRDLMISYGRVGDILGNPSRANMGDKGGALENFQKARAIAESLAAADPQNQLARMDLAQIWLRIGAVMDAPNQARESLALLESARQAALPAQANKEPTKDQIRLLAWIDENRGIRIAALGDANGALTAFQHSLDEANQCTRLDATDSSSWTQVFFTSRAMAPHLASMGRREEALRLANQARAEVSKQALTGPDPKLLAVFVPRVTMVLGATYDALARSKEAASQSEADRVAAAVTYAEALKQWQALSQREDFPRFRAEVSECSRRAAHRGQ